MSVTKSDVASMVSSLVNCVGCRRSVETLFTSLTQSHVTALEPLMVSSKGVVSISKDHIKAEKSLANLFCNQVIGIIHRNDVESSFLLRWFTCLNNCPMVLMEERRGVARSQARVDDVLSTVWMSGR